MYSRTVECLIYQKLCSGNPSVVHIQGMRLRNDCGLTGEYGVGVQNDWCHHPSVGSGTEKLFDYEMSLNNDYSEH